jgi:hypothetical protein
MGGLFVLALAERSEPPAGLTRGIRRAWPCRAIPLRIARLLPLRGSLARRGRAVVHHFRPSQASVAIRYPKA